MFRERNLPQSCAGILRAEKIEEKKKKKKSEKKATEREREKRALGLLYCVRQKSATRDGRNERFSQQPGVVLLPVAR